MSYHESNAKKIHYSKLDPALGFAFLLKRESDLKKFKEFMALGKKLYKSNWIFHTMASKPDFMKSKPIQKKKVKLSKPVDDSFEDIEDMFKEEVEEIN